ncbi:MAG: response regulator [Planctomycetes bacterium]|nr:response regulator [Planctomycetota bacterium]
MFGRKKVKVAEKRTVLFVDDDEIVLVSLVKGLQDQPYNILSAKSGEEALEILQHKEVHVILADMCMPEMSGLELLRTVRKEYPDIIGMILTGYMQDTELQAAEENREVFKLIPKPWKLIANFETLIQRAVDKYNLQDKHNTVRR